MKRFLPGLAVAAAALAVACNPSDLQNFIGGAGNLFGGGGGGEPNDAAPHDDKGGLPLDPNHATEDHDGAAPDDDSPDGVEPNPLDDVDAMRSLSGVISAPASKRLPRSNDLSGGEGYQVVVQSADTMEVYSGQTDGEGAFRVDIPEQESGQLFIVTLMSPEGQVLGPVVFNSEGAGGAGKIGLELLGDASLGAIQAPELPGDSAITPGDDHDLDAATVAEDVEVRLDDAGVPIGVSSVGKGDDAQIDAPTDNPRQMCDSDMDGLIDIFDADDNGNGAVDDFDPDHHAAPPAELHGIQTKIFMNLKIGEADAAAYFGDNAVAIEESLKTDTVITFEARYDGRAGRTLIGVRALAMPAPSYLPFATVLGGQELWSATDYKLRQDGANHFQAFITPNALINAGDVFTLEYLFDDGSTRTFTEMINYVFKSIPKLVAAGSPAALTAITGPSTILFDGTQDLVLEWNPPVDERGVLLVGIDYRFELFFHDSSGMQINAIDGAATWPTPISGWDATTRAFSVPGALLAAPGPGGVFQAQLPAGIFVDTVQTSGGPVAVATYVIDIASQDDGNNSALKVRFDKQ